MKLRTQLLVNMLVLAAAMGATSGASAQSAGRWAVKAGLNLITPKVESGDVSAPGLPGTKASVGTDMEPVLVFAYGLSDNVTAEIALGFPYTHNLYGAGSIEGSGKLGSVEALPPTVLLQYRFMPPQATLRPYVGAGLTYVAFQSETGSGRLTALTNPGGPPTTFSIDAKAAGTVQVGMVVNFSERWFGDVAMSKTFLKTRVHYSTGQIQDMTLDPVAVCLGIGYKF